MTQISLPPPTRRVGQGNPPADMDQVVTALLGMQAVQWITPTGDTSGAADTANLLAALAALPAAGGTVWLAPGTFYITCGSVAITPGANVNVFVRGCGRWATIVSAVGTGDCIRLNSALSSNITPSGGLYDFTIDGTNAGNGSAGLHYGDMRAVELRIGVQNFSGTGSIGVHFDNQYGFTEETHGYLWLSNNTQNLVFDVSDNSGGSPHSSTNSFGYTDLHVEILAKVGQDGVVLQNGALLYNSRLLVKANFQGNSSAQANAVLRITGQIPSGHTIGGFSAIESVRLDVMAECSNAIGTHAPQTIVFGTLSSNQLIGCTGIMDFAQGAQAFAVTNWTATGAGGFSYDGVIRGDFNLNNATVGTGTTYSFICQGVRSFGKALLNATNGNLQVDVGDFFQVTLSQDITVNLNPGGSAAMGSAQRKTIIITQAAAGGPYTVTWPNPGSPSVTNCAVKWPGGVAPTMSTGAGAVDEYELVTYNGAVWYGIAHQAMA